jgi:hypothetical protein
LIGVLFVGHEDVEELGSGTQDVAALRPQQRPPLDLGGLTDRHLGKRHLLTGGGSNDHRVALDRDRPREAVRPPPPEPDVDVFQRAGVVPVDLECEEARQVEVGLRNGEDLSRDGVERVACRRA